MKNTEIKVQVVESKGLSRNQAIEAIALILNEPLDHHHTVLVYSSTLSVLEPKLKEIYGERVSIRQGWSGGCYGARDGSGGSGLTLYFEATELVSEYKSKEYGWAFNPTALLKEHGTLVESIEGDEACDAFTEACEAMGLKVISDNTYNHANRFMFDFQLTVVENEDQTGVCYMAVMFHCGGDIRGNYTSKQLWKFESHDDLYSVLFPPEYDDDNK